MRALWLVFWLTSPAWATTWFTDGSCPNDGNGTAIGCAASPGAAGAFFEISEGVHAMVAGDTLSIRGPHAGFDGIYRQEMWLDAHLPAGVNFNNRCTAAGTPALCCTGLGTGTCSFGAPLPCTALAPCVIRAARAADGGGATDNEQVFVRVARVHNDWTCQSGCGTADAIWSRPMELAVDQSPDGTNAGRGGVCNSGLTGTACTVDSTAANSGGSGGCGASATCPGCCIGIVGCPSSTTCDMNLDPFEIYTNHPPGGDEHQVEHPYAVVPGGGDNKTALADLTDGHWSYHTQFDPGGFPGTIWVNPYGSDDPNLTIEIPFAFDGMQMDNGSAYITFQDIYWQRSRGNGVSENPTGATFNKPGMVFRRSGCSHYKGKCWLTHLFTNAVFEDTLAEYCGRGMSNSPTSGDGCWGDRIFNSPGFQYIGHNVRRFLGAAGEVRVSISGTCTGGTRAGLVCHNGFDCPGGTCSIGGTAPTHLFSHGDPPWNDMTHTYQGISGLAGQHKQCVGTLGVAGSSVHVGGQFEAYQVQEGCFSLDTVTEGLIEGMYCHDSGSGFAITNTTPTPLATCHPGSPTNTCYGSGNIVRNSRFVRLGGGATNSTLGNNGSASTVCATDSVAVCHGGANLGLPCASTADCPGAVAGTSTDCFVERQPGHESEFPFQIYNTSFASVGWAALGIWGGATAGGGCAHQLRSAGGGLIANNAWSATDTSSDSQCSSTHCRGLVIRDVSATGGLTVSNNTCDGMTGECLVISATAATAMAAAGTPLDYTLYGSQATLLPGCTSDGTNVTVRWNATIQSSGASGVPGSGTCGSVAAWQAANPTLDGHAVRGSPHFIDPTQDLHVTAGGAGIDVGQSNAAFFLTDADGTIRPINGIWDIGPYEFGSSVNLMNFTGPTTVGITF